MFDNLEKKAKAFMDGIEKSFDNFIHLDEAAYAAEISKMGEEQLLQEHKFIRRKIASSEAAGGASAVATVVTGGMAVGLVGIAARRIYVHVRQDKIIRDRLAEMGWSPYEMRFQDFALAVGPCAVAELVIPAGGALLGQAAGHAAGHAVGTASQHAVQAASQHATQVATQHATQVATQHATQVATQHATQVATQHAAENLVTHAPGQALSSVAHHASAFTSAAVQGAQSQAFTLSHGLIGHAALQTFYSTPMDLATAQASLLGTAAGAAGVTVAAEGVRWAAEKGVSLLTKTSIEKAIKATDEKYGYQGWRPLGDNNEEEKKNKHNNGIEAELKELAMRTIASLVNDFYKTWEHRDWDGTLKTDIEQMEACDEEKCDCADFNRKSNKDCVCGHAWINHGDANPADVFYLYCQAAYPKLRHTNSEGAAKTDMDEITACLKNGCHCGDFDHSGRASNCKCGHDDSWHSTAVTDDDKHSWLVNMLATGCLRCLVAEPDSSSKLTDDAKAIQEDLRKQPDDRRKREEARVSRWAQRGELQTTYPIDHLFARPDDISDDVWRLLPLHVQLFHSIKESKDGRKQETP